MSDQLGYNSIGEYETALDPRFEMTHTYLIPLEEKDSDNYVIQTAPIPATPLDILVEMDSDEFQAKNKGKLVEPVPNQLRINTETGTVHRCVYMPDYEA